MTIVFPGACIALPFDSATTMTNHRFLSSLAVLLTASTGAAQPVALGPLRVTAAPIVIRDSIRDTTRKARLHNLTITAMAQFSRSAMIAYIEGAADVLTPLLPAGTGIAVRADECGRPSFIYDPATRRVVLCYEMSSAVTRVALQGAARDRGWGVVPAPSDSEARATADGFLVFGILHEVGHALIHQRQLPLLGGEEEAADGFAVFALLSAKQPSVPIEAAQWFTWRETEALAADTVPGVNRIDYSDPHLLPGQRYARIACYVRGSQGGSNHPDDARCKSEWSTLSSSWTRMIKGIR